MQADTVEHAARGGGVGGGGCTEGERRVWCADGHEPHAMREKEVEEVASVQQDWATGDSGGCKLWRAGRRTSALGVWRG